MNEQTQPTDAELEAAWTDATGSSILPYPGEMLAFARAVLAKWGTPAGAGEFVGKAMSLPGASGFTQACFHSDVVPLGAKLYTTPQPTQAQAGADAVVEEVAKGLRRYGLTLVKTASGYDVLSLRDIAANGIKGADHGKAT